MNLFLTEVEARSLHNLLTRWGENAAHDAVEYRLKDLLDGNPTQPPHIHPDQSTVQDFVDSVPVDEIRDYIDPWTVRNG